MSNRLRTFDKILNRALVIIAIVLAVVVIQTYAKPSSGVPDTKADGSQVCLAQNSSAYDPTWAELLAFLNQDRTEDYTYSDTFMCADYAEALQHNAATTGIRGAYVIIQCVGANYTHAINAFDTTDRGLVYIDDTAGTTSKADKLAYVEIGKDYGIIDLKDVSCLDYDCYTRYMENLKPGDVSYKSMGVVETVEVYWPN